MVTRVLVLSHIAAWVSLAGLQGIVPAIPAIQEELQLTHSQATLLLSAYLLPSALLAFPAGVLADRVGRRAVFVGSLTLFGACGLASLAAHSFEFLLVLRVLQGASFAAILPLSLTMLGDVVSGHAQTKQQSLRSFLLAAGDALWPLLCGLLTLLYWAAPLVSSALALPIALLGWRWLDAPAHESVATPRLAQVIRSLANRRGVAVQFAGFARFLFKFVLFALLPLVLFQRGQSTLFISTVVGVAGAAAMVSAVAVPWLLKAVRPSSLMLSGLAAYSASFAVIAAGDAGVLVVVPVVVCGLADGVMSVLSNGFLLHSTDSAERATIVGAAGAIKNFAKFFAPTCLALLTVWVSLPVAFAISAVVALVGLPLLLPLRALDEAMRAPRQRTG